MFLKVQEQLTPGAIIKNYRELCSLLELPVAGGCTKKSQMAALNRMCTFEKDGQRYIITEVFDEVREKELRPGNKAIYVTYIESILLSYFIKQGRTSCNFTKRQLWEILGMVNKNFVFNYKNKGLLYRMQVIDNRVNQWSIDRFYSRSKSRLNDIIDSALRSLQKRKLIEYRDDVLMASRKGRYYEVTDEVEIEHILEIEKETLNKLGCKSINEVIFNSNSRINYDVYTRLTNQMLSDKLGIDFVYRRYFVVCTIKYLEQGLHENEEEMKRFLNEAFIDSVNASAEKEYENNRVSFGNGETWFEFPEWYVEVQRLLAAKLLDIDEPKIPELIDVAQDLPELDELFAG